MIEITKEAVEEVKRMIEKENRPGAGLRIGVKGGGCSGYTYALDLDDQPREGDKIIEAEGIKVYVDPKSYFFLNGGTLEYAKGMMGSGFSFKNPNAKGKCGCGASFSI